VTIELRGDAVTLRAFRPDEYDEMITRIPGGDPNDPEQQRIRRSRLEHSGARSNDEVLLAIESGGHVVGDLQGRSIRMAMPAGVWEVGIELWDTGDRDRGLGREAVTLLTSYLFAEEGAHRVQGSTDVDNAAMRRVFEVLGFIDEGTMRGFMPTADGGTRDYELYAVTRHDWDTRDH
jgi:RimJ/RimL family protein N-acetyltransferase